ncbi:MAG: HPr-rel-A system PqqD family peptide chaperone [Pseudomonadota bacterium]
MAELWKSVDPSKLEWRVWSDEHVVYDDGSGDTHLLDDEAAGVLRRLCQGPASADQLVAELAQELEIEPNQVLESHVEAILKKFRQLALIEPEAS